MERIRIVGLVEILPVVWALFEPADTAVRTSPRLVCISLLKPNPFKTAVRRDG